MVRRCIKCGVVIDDPLQQNCCQRCSRILAAEANMEFSLSRGDMENYEIEKSKLDAWNATCPICGAITKDIEYDSISRRYSSSGYYCNCGSFFDSGTLSERVQKGL